MLLAAIVLDWCIGDPRWPTHPVIRIGQWIGWLESLLHKEDGKGISAQAQKLRGLFLLLSTLVLTCLLMYLILWAARWVHPWIGYAVNTWFISTTIAIKGLKDAAMRVYRPLQQELMD